MCTGFILLAGFKVIIGALNQAGIDWNNLNTFGPLEGKELIQITENFIYPKVESGRTSRPGFGKIPECFVGKTFYSVENYLDINILPISRRSSRH